MTIFRRLAADRKGATAIEYGLLIALVSMIMLAALSSLGFTLSGVFETITTAMGG